MFRTAPMYHIVTAVPRISLSRTLTRLHHEKISQVIIPESNEVLPVGSSKVSDSSNKSNTSNASNPESSSKTESTTVSLPAVESIFQRVSQLRQKLDEYGLQPKRDIIKELFTRKTVSRKNTKPHPIYGTSYENLIEDTEKAIAPLENQLAVALKKSESLKESIEHTAYVVNALKRLPKGLPISALQNTECIHTIVGNMYLSKIPLIEKQLKEKALIHVYPFDKSLATIIVTCTKKDIAFTEQIVHDTGFEEFIIPQGDVTVKEMIEQLEKRITSAKTEQKQLQTTVVALQTEYNPLLNDLYIKLSIIYDIQKAKGASAGLEGYATFEAWVPQKELPHFTKVMESENEGYVFLYCEKEDAPTLLENPQVIKPFESITALYALPSYKQFDPTPILAVTFSLFFGFMLTDVIYGLILLIFGILLLRGKGSYHEMTRNISIVLIAFGGATLILGSLFGSYFGNFFQSFGISIPALIDPMSQVMTLLILTLVLGVIHLGTGLFIGFIENIRKGDPLTAFHTQGVWILFLLSILCIVAGLQALGLSILFSSVILQIVLTYIKSDAITSVLSIFNFPSFIGDLFSYGRLMALALGTAGIALAVNFMTVLSFSIPIVGPVIAVLIFVIGHTFNMAMNGLGAFVHSIRLHFLEFFTRFYDANGNKYVPFGHREE